MNSDMFSAFRDELEKCAAPPLLAQAGHFLRQSPLRTAAIGAGVGALAGAAANPEDRLGGARRGALLGGAVGGIGAGAARAARDTQLLAGRPLSAMETVTGTAKRFGEGGAAFVRRQVHGLTGAYADPAKTRIRSSVEAARRQNLLDARLGDDLRMARNPQRAEAIKQRAAQEAASLKEWGEGGDRALKAGITSAPGVVKGLAGKNRKETLSALKDEVLGGRGGGRKAQAMALGLGVGLPAVSGLYDISKGDESAAGGRTVGQKAMNLATNVGVGTLTMGMPFGAQMITSSAADALGQKLVSPRWMSTHRSLVGERARLPVGEDQ